MRKSGILMHLTSLPGPYGIGTMGKTAYDFVDNLHAAGQSFWQVLPLNPTGYGDSPYQAFSAFAGNHYLIDLDSLIREGLLTEAEVNSCFWGSDVTRVDFASMYDHRGTVLHAAWSRFRKTPEYDVFVLENAYWLADYSLFMALKERYHGADWQTWPEEIRTRQPDAVYAVRRELAEKIDYQNFLQYTFFRQWSTLRTYARSKGVEIIGDIPIYVPLDSADVWANTELFQLDENRRPCMVAGCPPDSFNRDGQLWGNPIYDWQAMHDTGYSWWIRRFQAAKNMYDVIRLDHFRGFESYWAVPAGDATAVNGTWVKGPGMDFIGAIQRALPEMRFIAEDLGYVTAEVRQLQEDSGFPSMKVLQFAFDTREDGDYYPHNYPVNSVCYSGTHDNPTTRQWFDDASAADIQAAKEYLGLSESEGLVWGMIRGCMSSVSRLCVIQMQDYLELGAQARMNCPGILSGNNWVWRAQEGFFTPELTRKIHDMTKRYGRLTK